jgi:hypothetical protein
VQVGDLIRLKKHCKHNDRWAIIVRTPIFRGDLFSIMYVDDPAYIARAAERNIKIYSELRKGKASETP